MISRVAENCFWLHRCLERVDSLVAMINVNLSEVLDQHTSVADSWRAVLVACGEAPQFAERCGAEAVADGEAVQDYLVWDIDNVASVLSMVTSARENARTVRETISLEMWLAVNGLWLWMTQGAAKRRYRQDRPGFYARLRQDVELLRGLTHGTILHDEAFHFMRLGLLLERAGQTARILDVKHHLLGPNNPAEAESPAETSHWLSVLRTLTATESFFKRVPSLSGLAVVQFLLLERQLPRSVRHCLVHAAESLEQVRAPSSGRRGNASSELLEALRGRLRDESGTQIVGANLHRELTYVIDGIADLCNQLTADFFDPTLALREADAAGGDNQ